MEVAEICDNPLATSMMFADPLKSSGVVVLSALFDDVLLLVADRLAPSPDAEGEELVESLLDCWGSAPPVVLGLES
jgi:hypothetical protein